MSGHKPFVFVTLFLVLGCVNVVWAQSAPAVPAAGTASTAVPRLVKFSGAVKDADSKPRTGVTGITFALYKEQAGGEALWLETQNVTLDQQGRYTVLLGANSPEGVPLDAFTANEAQWLGIQPEGLLEQRVLLVSVPYALKAADAETLGGMPASSFVLAAPLATGSSGNAGSQTVGSGTNYVNSGAVANTITGTANYLPVFTSNAGDMGNSVLYQQATTNYLGIGTANPQYNFQLQVVPGEDWPYGGFSMVPAFSGGTNWNTLYGNGGSGFSLVGTAKNKGYPSSRLDMGANSTINFQTGDGSAAPTSKIFVTAAGNVGIGTITPTQQAEVAGNVKISGAGNALIFSDGSVMSSATTGVGGGTITAVNTPAGSGLMGGGTSGALTLGLSNTCAANQVLRWTGSAWACSQTSSVGQGLGIVATPNPIVGAGTMAIDPLVVPQLGAPNNTFAGNITAGGNITTAGGNISGFTFTSTGVGFNNTFAGPVTAPTLTSTGNIVANAGNISGFSFTSIGGGANNFAGQVVAPVFTQNGAGNNNIFAGNLSVGGTLTAGSVNFTGNNGSQIVSVTQSGQGYGLLAETASTIGSGVVGRALSPTGPTAGVEGLSTSTGGAGVYGQATSSTGIGVLGNAPGIAVLGNATSPGTIGVEGTVGSMTGTGVVGLAGFPLPSPQSNTSYGVQGISALPNGIGVLGFDTDTTGPIGAFPSNAGVEGISAHPLGAGVYGQAQDTSTTTTVGGPAGVYGQTASPLGTGVYGLNTAGLSIVLIRPQGGQFGVQGVGAGVNGTGVFGHALDTSGTGTTIGVQGIAEVPTGGNSQPFTGTGVQGIGGLGGVIGISPTLAAQDASLASLNPPTGTPEVKLHPGVVGIGGSGVIGLVDGATVAVNELSNLPVGVFGKGPNGVIAESDAVSGSAAYFINSNSQATDTAFLLQSQTNTLSKGNNVNVFSVTNTGSIHATDVMNLDSNLNVNGALNVLTLALNVNGNSAVGGNLSVTGSLSKASGSFKIDHPLDPEHKILYHSFVESPDMKNVYDGLVTLDANGRAWVELPDYFEALNRDFRYQLTAIGAPAPSLYIAQEVHDNRFRIAGGKPGGKVSWQVTGIRQDAYARKHRIQVEEEKPADEQGFYLSPDSFGQPEEKGVAWARSHPAKPKASPTESAVETPVGQVVAQK